MALWSLFVEVGHLRYSTQVTADDPRAAIRRFLKTGSLREVLQRLSDKGWPASFSTKDIVAFIPMDGLTNMYLCEFAQKGKYASVVMARTVSRKHA